MKTEKTIGETVAQDYRTAAVFENYGIDFCCGGSQTIDEACKTKGISKDVLLSSLENATKSDSSGTTDYNAWPIDLLTDYIEKKHHRYIEEKTPLIKQYLDKICTVHGKQHPQLFQIRDLFFQSAADLAAHMKKEELILFPFVRKMAGAQHRKQSLSAPHFGTVQHPIQMMKHEHDSEGDIFKKIADLSNNYTPPANGCNTYKTAFSMLKEFEKDLHTHIHLENNILFPKSIEMEKELNHA